MWEWNGETRTWQEVPALRSPPARGEPALVYDERRQVVVHVGGSRDATDPGDTREWDGRAWKSGPPPPGISGPRPVVYFDAASRTVTALRREAAGFARLAYDGAAWRELPHLVGTPPNGEVVAAYDPARRELAVLELTGGGTIACDGARWHVRAGRGNR